LPLAIKIWKAKKRGSSRGGGLEKSAAKATFNVGFGKYANSFYA
jgi:hypothetical protein